MRISDWSSDVCSSDLVYGARFEACLCNFLYGINLQGYAGNRPRLAQTLTIADHHRPATFVYLFRCQAFHNDFGTHPGSVPHRSEEHTSELQSLVRISYAVFCLKKKKTTITTNQLVPPT